MLGFLPYDAPFLNGIDKKTKARIRVGVAAFLWEIWNCRNDVVFNKQNNIHFLQVVNKAMYSIQMWSFADQRGLMDTGCARMMAVVRDIYSRAGWLNARRLDVSLPFLSG